MEKQSKQTGPKGPVLVSGVWHETDPFKDRFVYQKLDRLRPDSGEANEPLGLIWERNKQSNL